MARTPGSSLAKTTIRQAATTAAALRLSPCMDGLMGLNVSVVWMNSAQVLRRQREQEHRALAADDDAVALQQLPHACDAVVEVAVRIGRRANAQPAERAVEALERFDASRRQGLEQVDVE